MGYSDKTVADFLLASAKKAKDTSSLLKSFSSLGIPVDSSAQSFAEGLLSRLPRSGSKPSQQQLQHQQARQLVKRNRAYGLLDDGDDAEDQPAAPSSKPSKSSSSKHERQHEKEQQEQADAGSRKQHRQHIRTARDGLADDEQTAGLLAQQQQRKKRKWEEDEDEDRDRSARSAAEEAARREAEEEAQREKDQREKEEFEQRYV